MSLQIDPWVREALRCPVTGARLVEGTGPTGLAYRRARIAVMAYSSSIALQEWLTPRRESIDRIAKAHVLMGEVDGPGRPLGGREVNCRSSTGYVGRWTGSSGIIFESEREHHRGRAAQVPEGRRPSRRPLGSR